MTLTVYLNIDGEPIRHLEITNTGTTTKRPTGSNKKALQAQQDWDRSGSQLCVYQWVADDGTQGTIVHHRSDGAERLARRALTEYVISTQIGSIPA